MFTLNVKIRVEAKTRLSASRCKFTWNKLSHSHTDLLSTWLKDLKNGTSWTYGYLNGEKKKKKNSHCFKLLASKKQLC